MPSGCVPMWVIKGRRSLPSGRQVRTAPCGVGGVVEHLHEAIGVSLDKKAGKMYFTDLGGSIYSANFDGSEKKEILKGKELGLDLTGIWVVHFD